MMAVVCARRGDGRFRPGVSLSQMALPESGNVCGVRSLIGSSWRTRVLPRLMDAAMQLDSEIRMARAQGKAEPAKQAKTCKRPLRLSEPW